MKNRQQHPPTPRRPRKPKANTIAFFVARPLANGGHSYWWKPSRKWQAQGWAMVALGEDYPKAVARAVELNEQLEQGRINPASETARNVPLRGSTFDQLCTTYLASDAFTSLTPKTRREYHSQIKALRKWGGSYRVGDFTDDMVQDLANSLSASSLWVAKARIRVLSVLFNHAVKPMRLIKINPVQGVRLKSPPPRRKRITIETVHAIEALAKANGMEHVALGVILGFYTVQREADLLAATRINYRAMDDMALEDRRALAGADGSVMGFRLKQQKTGKWVDVILPPYARDRLDRVLTTRSATGAKCDAIIAYPGEDRECPDWRFQRDFRQCINDGIARAQADADNWLVDQLSKLQFRDLRRSGMCWLRDLGATPTQIATISGHSISRTQKILDTYLPSDTRAAAAGIGHAIRRQAQRDAQQKDEQA